MSEIAEKNTAWMANYRPEWMANYRAKELPAEIEALLAGKIQTYCIQPNLSDRQLEELKLK